MKECEEKKINPNPLNLKGGDVVEDKDNGILYIVVRRDKGLRLNSLECGSPWSSDSLMGQTGSCMRKVDVCFKRQ